MSEKKTTELAMTCLNCGHHFVHLATLNVPVDDFVRQAEEAACPECFEGIEGIALGTVSLNRKRIDYTGLSKQLRTLGADDPDDPGTKAANAIDALVAEIETLKKRG